MTPLERVTVCVNLLDDVSSRGTPLPLLTIAEFFDGNDAVGSIGCNLPGSLPPSVMRALCETIAARDDVKGLRSSSRSSTNRAGGRFRMRSM